MVPRSWIHDCDHDHVEHSDSEEDHDDCFVCELDLEMGNAPVFYTFKLYSNPITKPVILSPEVRKTSPFYIFDHRGPPSC